MIAEQLALIAATSFASARGYITVIEQPARLKLEPRALLAEWRSSHKRGTVMQVSLAVVAAGLGVASFVMMRNWQWLCGAVILLALLPYTLIAVMPVNRRLMSISADAADESVRDEVQRWGLVHAGRTLLGIAAALIFLWATL